MSDLLQEVDDIMRRERMERLWQENGNYIIGFIVAVILATAAYSGYQSWSKYHRISQTDLLIEALENDMTAVEAAEISGDLKAVALLTAAGQALDDGDTNLALGYYRDVQETASGPLRGLGVIMGVRLADADQRAGYLPDLQKIAGDQSSPWRFHAFVEAAVIEAAINKNYETARTYLQNVTAAQGTNVPVPPSLIQRVQSLDHVYKILHAQSEDKQKG